VWRESDPMAPYLATTTLGKFDLTISKTSAGIPTYVAVDPQLAKGQVLSKLPEAVDFYTSIYGPYPFDAVGAIVDSAKIVRTGSLELQVADVTKALTGGRAAMAALGGYIGSSQQQRSGDQTVATVTYRIPVARWEDALAAMRGLGTVISEATDAAEVTAQIVDLDARIRNLKASEVALVGYAEKAPKVSDLLEIQARLTDTRGQIEQLTAQQADLSDRAALATLTVTFGTEIVAVTQAAERWDPAAEVDRASATLISMGQAVVSFAIVVAIVWLPVLLVIGFIALVSLLIARRLGWRRPGNPPSILPPAVSPPAVSPPA